MSQFIKITTNVKDKGGGEKNSKDKGLALFSPSLLGSLFIEGGRGWLLKYACKHMLY